MARRTDHVTPFYPQNLVLKLVDQRRSFSRYNSLADKRPRSLFCFRGGEERKRWK
jgi:hypothetical protein